MGLYEADFVEQERQQAIAGRKASNMGERVYTFDRYVDGIEMAGGVTVSGAENSQHAIGLATRIAPRVSGVTVLVLQSKPRLDNTESAVRQIRSLAANIGSTSASKTIWLCDLADQQHADLAAKEAEIARLEKQLAEQNIALDRAAEVESERDALKTALQPFAGLAPELLMCVNVTDSCIVESYVRVGDIRNAHRKLAGQEARDE